MPGGQVYEGEILCRWLGRVPYGEALERQRAAREALIEGKEPEQIWLLEHDPVITTGRRATEGLPDEVQLAAVGIARFAVERGGLATWHGPGQLVAYLIINIGRRGIGVRGFVQAIEEGLIRWLADQGIGAGRREGFPGVWVNDRKICAIGLHIRLGVSIHGLALNLHPELGAFDLFVPCGIPDAKVTSVEALLGRSPSLEEAATTLGPSLAGAIRAAARAPRERRNGPLDGIGPAQ